MVQQLQVPFVITLIFHFTILHPIHYIFIWNTSPLLSLAFPINNSKPCNIGNLSLFISSKFYSFSHSLFLTFSSSIHPLSPHLTVRSVFHLVKCSPLLNLDIQGQLSLPLYSSYSCHPCIETAFFSLFTLILKEFVFLTIFTQMSFFFF